jgi:hypothetical protein
MVQHAKSLLASRTMIWVVQILLKEITDEVAKIGFLLFPHN